MEIKDKFKIVQNHYQRLLDRDDVVTTEIARLTAYGCIDAKEYWKDGKYLYLLYSMKNGVRKKKYVGNHPLRINEARKKLQNYKDRKKHIRTQEKIQKEIEILNSLTSRMLHICSKTDLSAKAACQTENIGDKFFDCRRGSVDELHPIIGYTF